MGRLYSLIYIECCFPKQFSSFCRDGSYRQFFLHHFFLSFITNFITFSVLYRKDFSITCCLLQIADNGDSFHSCLVFLYQMLHHIEVSMHFLFCNLIIFSPRLFVAPVSKLLLQK